MLYRETVTPELLASLGHLMTLRVLSETRLVGGTALALQLGHRQSVDIDLFGNIRATGENLMASLSEIGEITTVQSDKAVRQYFINQIKVDIVNYQYDWIAPLITNAGIRMADKSDIAAMKVSAITNRGSRKDFVDLFFLLEHYSLQDILDFYLRKYPDGNDWLAIRSLGYFDDAEQQPMPKMYVDVSWIDIRRRIEDEVKRC